MNKRKKVSNYFRTGKETSPPALLYIVVKYMTSPIGEHLSIWNTFQKSRQCSRKGDVLLYFKLWWRIRSSYFFLGQYFLLNILKKLIKLKYEQYISNIRTQMNNKHKCIKNYSKVLLTVFFLINHLYQWKIRKIHMNISLLF
jgi:hypothetical protein